MDFDYEFAKKLGMDKQESKLASAMDQLSVEELEGLLKEAKPQTDRDIAPSKHGVKPSEYCDACDHAMDSCVCKDKKSSITLEMADQWGRDLAKQAMDLGRIGKSIGEVGKHVMKTPVGKRMAIGAAAGAGEDMLMNQNSDMGSMATKAIGGAAAGRYAKRGLKALKTHGGDLGKGVAKGMKGWQNEPK